MRKFLNHWIFARLSFILASIEFGTERWLYLIPSFEKKREYVAARAKFKSIKKRSGPSKQVNRKGQRGK